MKMRFSDYLRKKCYTIIVTSIVSTKQNSNYEKERLYRCGFGCKIHPGKYDTPGKPFHTVAALIVDHRKIEHLQMKRLHLQKVNQTSNTLL